MIRINDILDKILEFYPDAELDIVDRGYIYSARVHAGQTRLSGEPYLSHPLEVAGLLAEMKLDGVSVAAGLLHDVVEDTHASIAEIEEIFGDEVAHIVSGVTKLSKLSFDSSIERQAESIRKMILAMADDIRVILIKLADRVHNMRTLQFHKPHKQKIIAQETIDIYAPIASRLGIYWIKQELEDSSFKYILPDEYEEIKNLVNKDRTESEKYIATVKTLLLKKISQAGLNCNVLGRYKQRYSIYQKMILQELDYSEVYDIFGFRIILDSTPQCYEALGLIHSLWQPIPKKFKDYIGMPKANMYQSLHTTVIGPIGERIEIQIRTKEMDQVAKSGIAAHWSYKEGRSIDENVTKAYAWIQNLVENQKNFRDPNEFMENVRIDLFPDEIYVFTPRGEIKSLPKNATPVDFAYMIHTEIGNKCSGAKINGRIKPLSTPLNTGDKVEIITSKNHHPSRDWLNHVKTVKARSRVRYWIKTKEKKRSISLGKEMCEKGFRKYKMNYTTLSKTDEMDEVVKHFGFKKFDDLIAEVGFGKITPLQIINKLVPQSENAEEKDNNLLQKLMGKVRKKKTHDGILVKGMDDILVRIAKCCQPVPGDAITGYITRGFGVTIHQVTCLNALKLSSERKLDVQWNKEVQETYPVKIHVRASDRFGLLADITSEISKNKANILHANTEIKEDTTIVTFFTIAVENLTHLHNIIAAIKKIKYVHEVKRLKTA